MDPPSTSAGNNGNPIISTLQRSSTTPSKGSKLKNEMKPEISPSTDDSSMDDHSRSLTGPTSPLPPIDTNAKRNLINLGMDASQHTVTRALHERYTGGHAYTRIGGNSLIVLNPFSVIQDPKPLDYDLAAICSEQNSTLEPHPYEIASGAYLHLIRGGEDQSIILR